MHTIIQGIIWAFLMGLSIFNPMAGGLALLFGYAIAGKFFALINIYEFIKVPLFITEPVLFILLVRAVEISIKEHRLSEWEINTKNPWLWFYLVGMIGICRGYLYAGMVSVLRDAMIVFYGVVAQITIAYVRNIRHIKTIYIVVLVSLILRLFMQPVGWIFYYGVSEFGMYAAFITIGAICSFPIWGRFKAVPIIVLMVFIGLMTVAEIRTVWVAFLLSLIFLLFMFMATKINLKLISATLLVIPISILTTISILKIASPSKYKDVKLEFFSMFAGRNSPNLLTRIAMWEDAIQEVIPGAGKLFYRFDHTVLFPRTYGSDEKPEIKKHSEPSISSFYDSDMETSATEILSRYEHTPISKAPPKWIENNKYIRFLFGVPFGYRFVPDRISAVHRVNRYDPHNSIIAMFYRTGIVGFSFFILIIWKAFLNAFLALKKTYDLEYKLLLIAVMSCAVYHLGHSLTDVTLENPFRGIPFWLLLGLMMALTRMSNNEKEADAGSPRA